MESGIEKNTIAAPSGNEPLESNIVAVSGRVTSELVYSHEIYGEGFYQFFLSVPRLSDSNDDISVTVSERLLLGNDLTVGAFIEVDGQFRSYNSFREGGQKLLLTVFAREIKFPGEETHQKSSNKIFLNGFLCKKPIYRSTPFGREITDLLVAVNRAYNKSDYIPCIAWGRNARFCAGLNVGDNIRVWGRVQSRGYQKKQPDGTAVSKVAYEVSLSKLEVSGVHRQGFSHRHEQACPDAPDASDAKPRSADSSGGLGETFNNFGCGDLNAGSDKL